MKIFGRNRNGDIEITLDGIKMVVPDDLNNRHRQMIAEWETQGNTIPEYLPPVDEIVDVYRAAVQQHIDSVAQSRRYDSGATFASYATDAEPNEVWREEAKVFVAWRSAIWSFVYDLEAHYTQPGSGTPPSVEYLVSILPPIEWPNFEGE